MVKALTISVSVLTDILIGRIQIIENHAANDAIAASERIEKRFVASQREVTRTRAVLDRTERQVVSLWRRLEPALEDFTRAENVIDRDAARRRIQTLRWEMDTQSATITAARELGGDDPRTAMRLAWVKETFGD